MTVVAIVILSRCYLVILSGGYDTNRRSQSNSRLRVRQLSAAARQYRAVRLRALAGRAAAERLYRYLGRALARGDRVDRRPCRVSETGAAEGARLHVSAWRLAAYYLQYAVFVDLRRQRRGQLCQSGLP